MILEKSKPRALVIGGSLGGLCSGVCLRAAGWRVSIFERSSGPMDDRGAGIVLQPEILNLLEGLKLATRKDISVISRERQYLNKLGEVNFSGPTTQFMTSWGALFNNLRRGFPDDDYLMGFKLVNFNAGEHQVAARFENGREELGSLLVGGDGAWSTVRQQLLPHVSPEYAGYVAWRGVVAESALPAALLATFLHKFTFYQMPSSHILCYAIPGAEGSIVAGSMRLNWVWFGTIGKPMSYPPCSPTARVAHAARQSRREWCAPDIGRNRRTSPAPCFHRSFSSCLKRRKSRSRNPSATWPSRKWFSIAP